MAKASKKKPFTKDDLEHHYWHIILTHGKRPVNVYAFVQELEIEETEFYKHVASFEALEARYWERLVEESIAVLGDDDDYADYSSDQKLLAFFYTFFQHAQKHRSRMVEFFPSPGCSKVIKPMRKRFLHYAKEIVGQGLEEGSVADRKNLTDKYPQLMFEQFRSIIEYHRKDQSEEFQDTDALIEKSVRLGADIARAGTLDSAIDLGRFLLRRLTVADN